MSAIASLAEDRVVEGVYAVARKERRRTKGGSPYLALELVDPSGRIEARVWSDVELLDGRFGEGDAVRVLGRVERFRDRLQLEVRSLEAAEDADPADFAPALRRDAAELDGFLEFLAGESRIRDCGRQLRGSSMTTCCGRRCARSRRRRRTTRTRAVCSSTPSESRRSAARPRSCTPGSGPTWCWQPPCYMTSAGRSSSSAGRRSARRTRAGCSATSISA